MARVQQPQKNSQKKINNPQVKNTKGKVELAKPNPKKEPSKNEVLFFRVGLLVTILTIVTVAIIFTIQFFMKDEAETGVFEDYIHVTATDLQYLTYDEGNNQYGRFEYFMGNDDYEELYRLIMTNDFIYIYFYKSSNLNEEVVDIIKTLNLEDKAFFLMDLDKLDDPNIIFNQPEYAHLNLDQSRTHMLLTFEIDGENPQSFRLDVVTTQIKITLNQIN